MHSVQFFSLTKKIISNCNKKGKGLRFQRQRQIARLPQTWLIFASAQANFAGTFPCGFLFIYIILQSSFLLMSTLVLKLKIWIQFQRLHCPNDRDLYFNGLSSIVKSPNQVSCLSLTLYSLLMKQMICTYSFHHSNHSIHLSSEHYVMT